MKEGLLPASTDLTIHSVSKISDTPLTSTSGKSSVEHFGLQYIVEEMEKYRREYERRRTTPNAYVFDKEISSVQETVAGPKKTVVPTETASDVEEDGRDEEEIWGMDMKMLYYGMTL